MNKASANICFYKNENGPVIGVTVRPVIEKDGLYFRDLTGDGRLAPYKDWRNTPAVRAASLAAELSADEKIGMLFVNSWKMGIYQEDRTKVVFSTRKLWSRTSLSLMWKRLTEPHTH